MAERVIDYISGIEVPATPEEIEATQVFSKLLVEDYGYPKEHIQTRPQFRVKVRPSDTKKEYPVDIMNCTPFVRQYDILSKKWGVLLCQKEYQTNDIRRSSREWL